MTLSAIERLLDHSPFFCFFFLFKFPRQTRRLFDSQGYVKSKVNLTTMDKKKDNKELNRLFFASL